MQETIVYMRICCVIVFFIMAMIVGLKSYIRPIYVKAKKLSENDSENNFSNLTRIQ